MMFQIKVPTEIAFKVQECIESIGGSIVGGGPAPGESGVWYTFRLSSEWIADVAEQKIRDAAKKRRDLKGHGLSQVTPYE